MTGASGGTGGGRRAGRRTRRAIYGAVLVAALAAACSGCMPWTSRGPPAGAYTGGRDREVITDPSISARHLVVLADDRRLQPAENVTPLVSRDVVVRYGAGLVTALKAVSARLGTPVLRALDARVEIDGQDPRQVADSWLRAQGWPGRERVDR
jgi:hypothetical protein